jgi:hypothetical protein
MAEHAVSQYRFGELHRFESQADIRLTERLIHALAGYRLDMATLGGNQLFDGWSNPGLCIGIQRHRADQIAQSER